MFVCRAVVPRCPTRHRTWNNLVIRLQECNGCRWVVKAGSGCSSLVQWADEISRKAGLFRIFQGQSSRVSTAVETTWRRGGDSNSRYRSRYGRFRGGSFQPLTHLSARGCHWPELPVPSSLANVSGALLNDQVESAFTGRYYSPARPWPALRPPSSRCALSPPRQRDW